MKNKQGGFILTLIIVIAAIVLIGGGYAAYHRNEVKEEANVTEDSNLEATTSAVITPPQIKGLNITPVTKGSVSISSVGPTSGAVGTTVAISGSGFTSTDNVIKFSGFTAATVSSTDGKTLSFSIPSSLSNCTDKYCTDSIIAVAAGSHTIQVVNSNGTSNTINFNVTSVTLIQ